MCMSCCGPTPGTYVRVQRLLGAPARAGHEPAPGCTPRAGIGEELELAEELPALLISAIPHEHYDPSRYRLRPAQVARPLHDGDAVDLGDRVFTVLHLPGHMPGSIALYDEQSGTIFTGDVIYDGQLLDEIVGSDIDDYLHSMRRLREIPVRVVHPGHGPSFDGARLHQLIDEYLIRGDERSANRHR